MDFLISGRVGISIIRKTAALRLHFISPTTKKSDYLLFAVTYSQHFFSELYLVLSANVYVDPSEPFIDWNLILLETSPLHLLSLVLLHKLWLKLASERDIIFYLYLLLSLRSAFLFFSLLLLTLL